MQNKRTKMSKKTTLKILVGYHKPAKLLKNDVLVPIHLGRALATEASKDGKMSADDYKWMLDNMIGDDTGDNISNLNRYFAEITAIYWAWKNYDKLGNPDYIGLAHYRRIFDNKDIKSVSKYDITVAKDLVYGFKDIEDQFNSYHYTDDLNKAIKHLIDNKPEYKDTVTEYLHRKDGYFYNMFIMKKEIFFEYCEQLFDILFKLHRHIDYDNLTFCNQRMPAYVAERLTGFFIAHKKQTCKINEVKAIFQDVPLKRPLKPVFKDAICICLSSDDNYAKYLGVTIASIKANKKTKDYYDICVLDGGISESNKRKISKMSDKTFSIRFVNINGFLDDFDTNIFSLNAHFTIATYFRFFIPQIFSEYDRVLYLDCDLVVDSDISELYNTNLGKYSIGAVYDIEVTRRCETDHRYLGNMPEYLKNKLKMKHPDSYFQAGVLVFDIQKLSNMDFTKKCINKLIEIKHPVFVDQCVLNALFDGEYKKIEMTWNVMWQLPIYIHDLDRQLDVHSYKEYMDSRLSPKVVHFAGGIKPWDQPSLELSDVWWKYARQTPFYENFLCDLTTNITRSYVGDPCRKKHIPLVKCRRKRFLHRVLAMFTFGKLHKIQKYKAKNYADLIKEFNK